VATEATWIAPPEGEAIADGAAVSSTGATADEMAIGSAGRTSRAGESAVAEAGEGPSRQGPTRGVVMVGACRPGEAAGTTVDAEGSSKIVAPGSRRVIKALMGASTSSGTSEDEPFWHGGSSPLETSTTAGYKKREHH
jgi:hypothetical protein